jgi:hypothetical protein
MGTIVISSSRYLGIWGERIGFKPQRLDAIETEPSADRPTTYVKK